MSAKLFWDKDSSELKAKLNSIIEVRNEDNLRTHFLQTMLFRHQGKVSGTIDEDNFKIWAHQRHPPGVTDIFYPIVQGRFTPLSQGLEIEFKSRMNALGKLVYIVGATTLGYGILIGIVIQVNNEMRFLLARLLVGAVLFGLMLSVPTFSYFYSSRIIKKYLIKELGLRNAR